MAKQIWRTEAKKRWGKEAAWIAGHGRFALLAWCRVLTVTLWETKAEAEMAKNGIDKFGCGGACSRHHEIVELIK